MQVQETPKERLPLMITDFAGPLGRALSKCPASIHLAFEGQAAGAVAISELQLGCHDDHEDDERAGDNSGHQCDRFVQIALRPRCLHPEDQRTDQGNKLKLLFAPAGWGWLFRNGDGAS